MSATDEIKNYYLSLGIKESVYDFCEATEQALLPRFQEIDRIAEPVSYTHLTLPTTPYG